jgi:uncharacterized protein YbaA (DUF1428 family)
VPYFDCYLAPVPKENRAAYEELARISEQVLRECGATRVVECWLDESGPDATTHCGGLQASAVRSRRGLVVLPSRVRHLEHHDSGLTSC